MRTSAAVLAMLLLLFAATQYNDPDGVKWALIYALGGFWAAMAAWRPQLVRHSKPVLIMLLVSLATAFAGMVYYWPDEPQWWRKAVWWHAEEAREGIGYMIVVSVLTAVLLSVLRQANGRG